MRRIIIKAGEESPTIGRIHLRRLLVFLLVSSCSHAADHTIAQVTPNGPGSQRYLRHGDLPRTELDWQLLIPGFPAIRTRRCSSFEEANRPKTMEVANIPGFSDHYLLLSQRKRGIVLLESQRKVLWAKSPMFGRARWL